MPLYLKNPHSILAALETRPQDVFEIWPPDHPRDIWQTIVSTAREMDIKIAPGQKPPSRRGKWASGRSGVARAVVKAHAGISLEAIFAQVTSPGLWMGLDTVQDPHNLGAIFRTAAFFGVKGILLTRDRATPLNATAYDVASGGIEHVPFTLQTNLVRALDAAKDRGLWILGTSERADTDLTQIQPDRPWLLVLGNEETGLRRLTQKKCDVLCRISSPGPIPSLNVSVAAGVLIHTLTPTST